MPFVCVQPMQTSWARRSEDLTHDKTDEKDAVLIARLTAQLRCYAPEPVDETWGRLRHLGVRRERLLTEHTAQVQQMRDLLECVWPAALDTAAQPFKSRTWAATMWLILDRDGGDLARTRRLGLARLEHLVRKEVHRWGATKPTLRITGLSYGPIVRLATVASKGMRIKLVLPSGTRSLDVSVRRDGKLIARRTVTGRAGAYTHTLKLSRKGSYQVVLRPQGTRVGTPATASFRVV